MTEPHPSPPGPDHPRLTPRQLECLRLVQAGKSSAEIGAILGLSTRTVEAYIAAACQRLGVHKRTEAVVRLSRCGLLGGD